MATIYHILGADIPHHNQTLLTFFQTRLLARLAGKHHFFVVGKAIENHSILEITTFPTKKAIAKAVLRVAKQEANAKFILHGQFNFWLWLAILIGQLPCQRLAWHIWGADLYEVSSSWKFKLFYPIRRLAQKKIGRIWATKGDLNYVWQMIRAQTTQDRLLYFPTKMPELLTRKKEKHQDTLLRILVGNSGDRSNNHIQALEKIYHQLGDTVDLIIPMGYPENNESYIRDVEQYAHHYFSAERVHILREKMDFAHYLQILTACHFGVFNFERQQGIGTLCLLLQLGIPFALNSANPFILDLKQNRVPFLYVDRLNKQSIDQVEKQLLAADINIFEFIPPNDEKGWEMALLDLMAE